MRLIDADALLNRMQEDPLFDLVERYGVSGVINAEPTVDAVPVDMIKGRINDLKKMLMDIGEDEWDAIWDLRTRIETLTELLEMWAERKDEYVTLHHEDIHFIDEDAERAFYEALAERKEE